MSGSNNSGSSLDGSIFESSDYSIKEFHENEPNFSLQSSIEEDSTVDSIIKLCNKLSDLLLSVGYKSVHFLISDFIESIDPQSGKKDRCVYVNLVDKIYD